MTEKKLQELVGNYVNGNLTDARRAAKSASQGELREGLKNLLGYSGNKAALTAYYLKTGRDYQAACDAE